MKEKVTDRSFADRLALAMREKGVSQTSFAAALGVSPSTVTRWLVGSVPRKVVMAGIAQFLDVNIEWLRDGLGERFYFSVFSREILKPKDFLDWGKMDEAAKDKVIERQILYRGKGIGFRVALLRKSFGMGLRGFASMCGCSPSYISRLERGSRLRASPNLQDGLMFKFGVNRSWLMAGDPPILLPGMAAEVEPRFVNILRELESRELKKTLTNRRKYLTSLVAEMRLTNKDLVDIIEATKVKCKDQKQRGSWPADVSILTDILTDRLRSGSPEQKKIKGA